MRLTSLVTLVLICASTGAYAQTIKTETSRLPDGCTRITITVDPGEALVKDVHLTVARTETAADGEQKTVKGDPMKRNYRDGSAPGDPAVPPAPAPPAGFTFNGLNEVPVPGGGVKSNWNISWTSNQGLGGEATFSVDYCGQKGEVKRATAENLVITKNGTVAFGPDDIVKKAKGHMPVPVLSMLDDPPRPQQQRRGP